MALKDWTQSMWDKIKAYSPFGQDDMESNMANGGFSGYKPNTAKHRAMRETMQQTAMGDMPQMDPMMTGMNWEQPQQMDQATAYGGFTGMMPPQATGYQATGYQQATAYQPTGYQQPMNGYTGMQQPAGYQPTGYQQPMNAWQEQPQQPYMDPMAGNGFGAPQQTFRYGNTVPFQPANQVPQQPAQPQQPDNISYMPGNFVGDDGKAYSHCERIAMIANVSMCYRIIEFMRNNESVIVSTEQITDEDENQRCLDLLYGAAFAMKCSFTRIAAKSIYLVAPGSVMVIPYKAVRQMSDQDIASRWPEQEWDVRRDRFARNESRYGARSQGYGRQQEGYTFGRRDYAQQDEYASYGGYNAVGYGR